MTTPPPIPPEAMDGRECLVWVKDREEPTFGACIDGEWAIDGGYPYATVPVIRAIPLSWCLAAPGMRSVLQLFHDIQIKNGHHICEEITGGCPVKIALAACDGKGLDQ